MPTPPVWKATHLRVSIMIHRRSAVAKVVVVVVLAVLVGAAFMLMTQEQKARSACEQVQQTLGDMIESGNSPTPAEVHEAIGREPHVTRNPGRHRLVEEYHWKGPMSSHRVYAYYTTGATQLLEAVSINHKLEDWEGDDK